MVKGLPRPSGHQGQHRVTAFVAEWRQHAAHHPQDAAVVTHISKTFAQRWPRLCAGYAGPERYRTNNELETFCGRLRTRQRQTNGHKSTPTTLSSAPASGRSSLTRRSLLRKG
jgi:hypothetical protein